MNGDCASCIVKGHKLLNAANGVIVSIHTYRSSYILTLVESQDRIILPHWLRVILGSTELTSLRVASLFEVGAFTPRLIDFKLLDEEIRNDHKQPAVA